MGDEIGSVTVVGGGDCGLLTALAIEKLNPDLRIEVVDDFEGSGTDVGKSTYHAILPLLHDFLDIDEGRFLQEVKPIWKASVFFRDWCGYDPFHFPFDMKAVRPEADDPQSGEILYHYYETQDIDTLCEQIVEHRTSPLLYSPSHDAYPQYPYMAYHLSIDRFNEFLRTLCREREIVLIDDEITEVRTDGNWISRVESETRTYDTDLYVDATGFNRLLMDHLEADFRSFDIPLDSALHAVTDNSIEDVLPATVVETGDYGWFWQIDTFDCRDLGYVFASEYVSEEDALSEFRAHRDEELTDVETYRFDSGFYDDAWAGNCVANGNAVGFIEPLESTALTTNLTCARRLSQMLASRGRINDVGVRKSYNSFVRGAWNSIYDFISVHYKFADGDNEFWEAMQSIPLSEKIRRHVEYFDEVGLEVVDSELVTDDGTEQGLVSFATTNMYLIMVNMGAESSFYETHEFTVSPEVREFVEENNEMMSRIAEECLSYEEVYKADVVDSYVRSSEAFWRSQARPRP